MPELPEVETMRRGIAVAAGAVISKILRPSSRLRPIILDPPLGKFRRRAVGCRIMHVGRLGKRVLLELDSGDRIVIEPRMTGLVLRQDPPDRKHLRLIIELSVGRTSKSVRSRRDGSDGPSDAVAVEQIMFWDQRGLGVVRLVSPQEFTAIYGPAKIGPDALAISAADLRQRIGRSARAVKVALLDQKALAGVGNLYASEILHRAGIHPAQRCRRLRKDHWQRIQAEMLHVLNDAILHQGSTLRDGTYRIARDAPGNYQFNHRVYQRHGKTCPGCGKAQIVRIVQAQRSTFYCPACQRK